MRSSAIGDIVCMYSAIKQLKEKHTSSSIHMMSRSSNGNIIKWFEEIDEHIEFDDKKVNFNVKNTSMGKHANPFQLLKFIASHRGNYDYIYVFQNSLKALLLGWILSPKISLVGYRNGFLSKLITKNTIQIDRGEQEYIKHLKIIGSKDFRFEKGFSPKNFKVKDDINELFKSKKSILLISPFAKWDSRSLDITQINILTEEILLRNKNIHIIFVGTKEKFLQMEDIKNRYIGRITNLLGKTSLQELFFAINNSSLFITVDSGPMHIAAHTSTSVFSLFGPTSPDRAGYKKHKKYIGDEKNISRLDLNKIIKDVLDSL